MVGCDVDVVEVVAGVGGEGGGEDGVGGEEGGADVGVY